MGRPAVSESREKTEVILLSGFLGAGKTTLLKRILSWESDLSGTIVIVNEFGDVGIDGFLLKDSGSDVIELTSGCICCTLSSVLSRLLTRIWNQYRPERILIESSGVADPLSILSVLAEPGLNEKLTLKKIITILDAECWIAREVFGPLFFNQLEMAHLIVLNKIDLLDKDRIPLVLNEIHEVIPNAQVVPSIHCRVDPGTLWMERKPKNFGLKPIEFFRDSNKTESVDAANYVTFSFQASRPLDEIRFKRFMEKLPFEVFRVKGLVRFSDRTVMVNFVGGRSEWSPWAKDAETQLAFIGWNISSEDLLEKLEYCVV